MYEYIPRLIFGTDAWAIPDSVEQVRGISFMVHALRNRQLRGLAQEALVMIEDDSAFYRSLARMSDIVHGEDAFTRDLDFSQLPLESLESVRENVQVGELLLQSAIIC
jgi:hypothetical protein